VIDASTPTITAANDIRIRIPSTFNMTWDNTDTTATFYGSASSKVSTTVSYEDGNKTLVLNVTSDFAASEYITMFGLSFKSFTAASATDNLELELNNDDVVTDEDEKGIKIIVKNFGLFSAADQTFTLGDEPTTMKTIMIIDNTVTPTIKGKKDIRIRIPSGFPMTWDTGITSVTIGGGAAAKMKTKLKAYEDGGKTLVLDVATDFAAGDYITVSGAKFANFTASSTADHLGMCVDDDGTAEATDDQTITISPDTIPYICSASDQIFFVGGGTTAISQITVTDASTPTITAANDIRIRIPSTFNMTWDNTDTTATIGGSASGKVSTTVSYEDGNKTLKLNVTSDFAAYDYITVSGLSFKSFTAVSSADYLEMELNNDDVVTDEDDRVITIITKNYGLFSAVDQTFVVGAPATTMRTIMIIDNAVTPTITGGKGGDNIRIRIPSDFNMTWDTGITTVTIGGGAAAKMDTKLKKYEDGGKTLVLSVKTSFAAGDYITVSGARFANFTEESAVDNLEMCVDNDGVGEATDDKTIEIVTITTAVNLISFTATGQGASVRVAWETAQEIDNMGFYLYRARSPGGPFIRLTDKLIPGLFSSVKGKTYTYTDTDVDRGTLYYYRLEAVDVHGKKGLHGPVCVDWDGDGMPDDWEIAYGLDPGFDDSGIDPDFDGLANLTEYARKTDPLNPDTDGDGIPDGQEDRKIERDGTGSARTISRGIRILESDGTGVTLELQTNAFDTMAIEANGKIFERLRIPDYIHGFTESVGAPELPMKGILIDLPEGKTAGLRILEKEDKTHSGYRIYPVPEKAVQGEGETAHIAEVFAMDEAAYGTDAYYPDAAARLGKTYTFRDRQKLQILFYPLAFNPQTGEIIHYTRIRVRVDYQDIRARSLMKEGTETASRRLKSWALPSEDPAYKISLSDEGIYRLGRGELDANVIDVDGMDLSQVRLYNLGEEVAISIYDPNKDNHLDSGDYIEFYATPIDAGYAKYAKNNVYWFTTSGGAGEPKRMAEIDGAPASAADPNTHTYTVHYEEDQYYVGSATGDDSIDRWFFDINSYPVVGAGFAGGGNPVDFTLSVPGVAGSGSLKISMWGYYDTDHAVDVSVNGALVGTFTWSDIAFYQAAIDDVDLSEGENTVTLTCNSGTDPDDLDTIFVDWFEVEYPRDFSANGNTLKFSYEAGYRYRISGFTGDDLLGFDITSPGEVQRIKDFQISGSGPYTLECEPLYDTNITGERTYLLLSSERVKTPTGISQDQSSNLSDSENGADYILITHMDLGWDPNGDAYPWLSDLVSLRQGQGLRVKVVDVEDIYDEFSYGIPTPQAVKDFLTHAYANWTGPAPQYVLLAGDGTYDPKNNWDWFQQDTTTTYLPPYLAFTKYGGETATDEWFVRVSGADAIPDMYIGRLPAANADQASVMVNKMIAYETASNTKTWEKNVLLFADNQAEDYEAAFVAMSEEVAAMLPQGLNAPFKGYLGDYLSAGYLTADIKEKINAGALLVNYSGHGSNQIWAAEKIFENEDVADLTSNGIFPFFVNMCCLTGNFTYPESWNFPSLAEALMRSEGKGAIAALMPSGMTLTNGQHILDTALFDAIFTQDTRTLGPAVSLAKQTLLANGEYFDETSETFLLFGDPAMTLKVPLPRRPKGLQAQEGEEDAVALSWQEATDCHGEAVAGYNLYRSLTPGGDYTKVNTTLITETEYDDTTAESGIMYYYVATSVDDDGDESVQAPELSFGVNMGSIENARFIGSGCFINTIEENPIRKGL